MIITCKSGKIGYATSAAAWKVVALRMHDNTRYTHKRKGIKGNVYRCQTCSEWHISSSHNPESLASKRRRQFLCESVADAGNAE